MQMIPFFVVIFSFAKCPQNAVTVALMLFSTFYILFLDPFLISLRAQFCNFASVHVKLF